MRTKVLNFLLIGLTLFYGIGMLNAQEIPLEEAESESPAESEWFMEESRDAFWMDLNFKAFEQDMYFANYSEAYQFVELLSSKQRAGAPMISSRKCRYAWKLLKKSKCKVPKKEFAKQLVKAIGSGNFSVNDGTITTPGIQVIKNEVTRLNVLIEVQHNRTLDYCNRMGGQCQNAEFIVNCNALEGKPIPEIIQNRYKECESLLKDDTSDFITVLREIGALVDKFQDGGISGDAAKNQISAKLDEITSTE